MPTKTRRGSKKRPMTRRSPNKKVQELARSQFDEMARSESESDPRVESRVWSRPDSASQLAP